jgi:hypothetical protein
MFNYAAFLVRRRRFAWIVLLSMMCLITSVKAQHGGGGHGGGGGGHSGGGHVGGHSSGGHFGGGHSSRNRSSSSHSGGHFGWLHVNFRNRAAHRSATANVSDASLAHWGESTRSMPVHPLPSTLIRTIPLESSRFVTRREPSSSSWIRHRLRRCFARFPYPQSSGCYFNGFNQVCFFEPLLPILFSSSYFGLQDYGFDGDAMDQSRELASTDTVSITDAPNTESENPPSMPPASDEPPSGFQDKGLDPRFFLLILKNGTEQVVTDYWVADGYIEYVSRDGSRSHIPIEALDLQATVTENSYRGLSFSLRSVPQQN